MPKPAHGVANDLPLEVWSVIAAELAILDPVTKHRDITNGLTANTSVYKNYLSFDSEEFEARGGDAPLLSRKYMGVNRAFFNYYLDRKYGEVQWTKWDVDMLTQLKRLQKPIVAAHVRRLSIRAWFIDSLMKRDQSSAVAKSTSLFRETQLKVKSLFSTWSQASYPPSVFVHPSSESSQIRKTVSVETMSSETVLGLMVSAMHNMRNLVTYRFELRDLSLTKHTERLLKMARLSFGSSLRRLVLHTTILKFRSVLDLAGFQNLDELDLHFEYQSHSTQDEAAHAKALQQEYDELNSTIVPFINSRKDVLRSFTFASYSTVDLAPFFRSIGPFPVLRRLSLNICLDEPHLSDVNALVSFLHVGCPSLAHVDLRPCTPDPQPGAPEDGAASRKAKSWLRLQDALLQNPRVLVSLEGLHMPVGDLDSFTKLVKRSTHTLTHLSLTGRVFNPINDNADLKRALSPFAGNPFQLQSVQVEVRMFNMATLKVLASRLPGLRSLVLVFEIGYNPFDELLTVLNAMNRPSSHPTNFDVEPGSLDWPHLQHITVVSPGNTVVSPQDGALLGIYTNGAETEKTYMDALWKKVEGGSAAARTYKGAWYHRRAFGLV